MIDLKSSTEQLGETVTQIITAVSGEKKTINGIYTNSIVQGQFTKFNTKDGRLCMVNDDNVFIVEVFREDEEND